jgi:uncharacterized membrane protein YozB (DUF420 family)
VPVVDFVTFVATVSLVVEMVVLALLTVGYVLRGRKMFRLHGFTMSSALVLHLGTIFGVMGPSLVSGFSPGVNYADWLAIFSLVHAALGTIGASLGVYVVVSWHFQAELAPCFARKKVMLTALTLWVLTILMGVVIYISLYGTRVFG